MLRFLVALPGPHLTYPVSRRGVSRRPGSVHLCEAHTRLCMRRRLPRQLTVMAVSWLFRG